MAVPTAAARPAVVAAAVAETVPAEKKASYVDSYNKYFTWINEKVGVGGCFTINNEGKDEDSTWFKVAKVFAGFVASIVLLPVALAFAAVSSLKEWCCSKAEANKSQDSPDTTKTEAKVTVERRPSDAARDAELEE